ncbi:hypothetical protein INR49_002096 [Caranx melampygus]|nr:hypothetical protein INR49_002096 [Caranx melampygus]
MSLNGKVALVTGGAQGIGRAVVQSLLQSSAKVAVVDLNKACGEKCKAQLDAEFGEGNCTFIQCDVSNGDALRDTFQSTVDHFGRLDIVINNAGINNEKNWEKTIQVNLGGQCPKAFVDTPLLHSVEHEDNMGKFVKFKDDFKRSMNKFGVLQPSLIAEGMMKLIQDSTLNGAVMKITCSKGIHFHTYEPMSA